MRNMTRQTGIPEEARSAWVIATGCAVVLITLAQIASCTPASRPDPDRKLADLAAVLEAVELDYVDTGSSDQTNESLTASFQPGIPDVQTSPVLRATSEPVVLDFEGIHSGDPTLLAQGTNTLIADASTGVVQQTIELTENDITRTIEQTLAQSDGTLTVLGTVSVVGAGGDSAVLGGGWVYSQGDGVRIHPDSEPGFHQEIAEMLHVSGGDETAPGLNLTLILLANTAVLDINYLRDALMAENL